MLPLVSRKDDETLVGLDNRAPFLRPALAAPGGRVPERVPERVPIRVGLGHVRESQFRVPLNDILV